MATGGVTGDLVGGQFYSFNKALKSFDDPFLLYSDGFFPDNLSSGLELCRYLWYLLPKYRTASQRVARHFVTEFEISGEGSSDEKKEFKEFLTDHLKLKSILMEMGDEEKCYGNAFYRIYYPFDRFLVDKRGGLKLYSISDFQEKDIKYKAEALKYEVPDPMDNSGKNKKVQLDFIDRPSDDKNRIKIRRIDPRYVALKHSHMSGERQIIYRFEEFFTREIKENQLQQINNTPRGMLAAIAQNKDYQFNEGEIFHFHAPMISGISYYGWSLPAPIANFRDIYQYQIYRKADEAVGLDYVLPFRVISPEANNIGDIMNNVVMKKWAREVKTMIQKRRLDKTSIHAFPFDLKWNVFGGESKEFNQKDMMEFHSNQLLDAAGVPAELYNLSMAIQQVPTAIRVFENQHWYIHEGMNQFMSWALGKITAYLGMENMECRLQRPSIADNIDKQNILLQLGMQGEIPRKHYMGYVGINEPEEAATERIDEDMRLERTRMEKEQEFKQLMENSINEQAAGGGQAPQGGEGGGTTPMDVQDEAMAKAQEMMQLPEGEKRKALNALRVQDVNLYALTKQFMEDFRQQGASEGRQQVNQQMAQGGGPPA
jgi:hypothetical protein